MTAYTIVYNGGFSSATWIADAGVGAGILGHAAVAYEGGPGLAFDPADYGNYTVIYDGMFSGIGGYSYQPRVTTRTENVFEQVQTLYQKKFFRTIRHEYDVRTVDVKWQQAYFVGLRSVGVHRVDYASVEDTPEYVETFGDDNTLASHTMTRDPATNRMYATAVGNSITTKVLPSFSKFKSVQIAAVASDWESAFSQDQLTLLTYSHTVNLANTTRRVVTGTIAGADEGNVLQYSPTNPGDSYGVQTAAGLVQRGTPGVEYDTGDPYDEERNYDAGHVSDPDKLRISGVARLYLPDTANGTYTLRLRSNGAIIAQKSFIVPLHKWTELELPYFTKSSDTDLQVEILQSDDSVDEPFALDFLGIFQNPLHWEISNDGGATFQSVQRAMNDPDAYVVLPNYGNELVVRATARKAEAFIQQFLVVPHYLESPQNRRNTRDRINGGKVNERNELREVKDRPMFQGWHRPWPRRFSLVGASHGTEILGAGVAAPTFSPLLSIDFAHAYWTEGPDFQLLGLADTDTVTDWPDDGTGTTTLSQIGTTGLPTYLASSPEFNNRPVVRFANSGGGVTEALRGTFPSNMPAGFEVVCIWRRRSPVTGSPASEYLWARTDAAGVQAANIVRTYPAWEWTNGGFSSALLGTNVKTDAAPHIGFFRGDNDTVNPLLRIDGDATAHGNIGNMTLNGATLNADWNSSGNNGGNFDIVFWGVKATPLTTSERSQFVQWAQNYYGIAPTTYASVRLYDPDTVDETGPYGMYQGRMVVTVPPIDFGPSSDGFINEIDLVVEDPDSPEYLWDIGVYTSVDGSVPESALAGGFTFDTAAPTLWDQWSVFRIPKTTYEGWDYGYPYGGFWNGGWGGPFEINVILDVDATSDDRWYKTPPLEGWVAGGSGYAGHFRYSTDGVTWIVEHTASPFGTSGSVSKVQWNGEYLLAIGGNGGATVMARSFDGHEWTAVPCPADGGYLYVMDWSPTEGGWLISGSDVDHNPIMFYGTPGSWTTRSLIPFYYPDIAQAVAWGDGQWVAGSNQTAPNSFLASSTDNGASWDLITTPYDSLELNHWANYIAYANGTWVVSGGVEDSAAGTINNVVYSTDLATWHMPTTPWTAPYDVGGANSGGMATWAPTAGRWYVGAWLTASAGMAIISSADLETWRAEDLGPYGDVGSGALIREHGGHFCVSYGGGYDEGYVHRFYYSDDGETWIESESPIIPVDYAYRVLE